LLGNVKRGVPIEFEISTENGGGTPDVGKGVPRETTYRLDLDS